MTISNKNKEINFTGFRFKCKMTKENNALRITSQSGRSMVEMLGVLAVVGVLSIGGVMGYSYGMDKYRANQTMQDINLRGLDLIAQASRPGDINLSEWGTHSTIGYEWGDYGETEGQDGVVDMAILGLPKRVCEMVYDGMKNQVIGVDISGVRSDSNENCAEEDNEMVFYFGAGGTLGETKICEIMGQNGCMSCDATEAIFDAYDNVLIAERCSMCENREMTSDGACVLKECPDGYQRDAMGGCFRCEENKAFIGLGDCSACDGYVPDMIGLYCTPDIECPDNQFLSVGGICVDCDTPIPMVLSTEEQCAKCTNREWDGSCNLSDWIEPECPVGQTALVNGLSGTFTCVSCDSPEVWNTEPNPFGEYTICDCPNRREFSPTYLCVKICPDDKPLWDIFGKCYACDDPSDIPLRQPTLGIFWHQSVEECRQCGRYVTGTSCVFNPCEDGEIWNGVSCEKTCSSDTECLEGQLCLSDNTSCEQANYNTCKSYTVVDANNNDRAILKQIIIDGSEKVSYWDAYKVCEHLGGILDDMTYVVQISEEHYDSWVYSKTSCNAEYGKEYYNTIDYATAPKNSAAAKAICIFYAYD